MKKSISIIQTCFSIEHADRFDNYMVLAFTENNQVISSHVIRFPNWWKYYDKRFRFYIFSHN